MIYFQAGCPRRHLLSSPGSLLRGAASCIIDKDLPHHSRSHSKEMNLVCELSLCAGEQLQISLMDQCSSLECVVGTLPGQVPRSDTVQFMVQRWSQFVQRRV